MHIQESKSINTANMDELKCDKVKNRAIQIDTDDCIFFMLRVNVKSKFRCLDGYNSRFKHNE